MSNIKTPNSEFIPFYHLAWDIRNIQCLLTNTTDAKLPCLLSGQGRFMVWYIRKLHFHPLLNEFPEGFLLVHLSPEFLLNNESNENINLKPSINQEEFEDYIINDCRVPLTHRFYSSPIQQQYSDYSSIQNQLLQQRETDSIHHYNSVEHCGEEIEISLSSYLLSRGFRRSGTSTSIRYSIGDESVWTPLKTHQEESVANSPTNLLHGSSKTTQPFFDFAIVERRLIPIPVQDVTIITILLNRLIRIKKMSLSIPIVFLLNDPASEAWPLYEHLTPACDQKDELEGIEESGTELVQSGRISVDHNALIDVTPAPIRNSIVANIPKHSDNDDQSLSIGEETQGNNEHRRRWVCYSRRTHCVMYSSISHRNALKELLGEFSQVGKMQLGMQSTETPRSVNTLADVQDDCYDCRQYEIRVPVLPQFQRISNKNQHQRASGRNCIMFIGDFIQRLLPKFPAGFIHTITPTAATKNFTVLNPNIKNPYERARMRHVGVGAQLIGPLLGSWRYDVISGSIFSHTLNLSKKEDRLVELMMRRATRSLSIVRGPVFSINTSRFIHDLWRTTISPSLPSPLPDVGKIDGCVGIRTGSGPDSALFWLWTDLVILHKLRSLRQSPMTDSNQIGVQCNEESIDNMIHPIEEYETIDTLIKSRLSNDKDDKLYSTLLYQALPSGELQHHAEAFIDGEKQINSNSILRRNVGIIEANEEYEEKEEPLNDLNNDLIPSSTTIEIEFAFALHPPKRNDRDFSDRLWQFIRRGYSVMDLHMTLQYILDCITAAVTQSIDEENYSKYVKLGQKRRTSILNPDEHEGKKKIKVQPLLPILRSGSMTKLSEYVRLVIRICQLHRYNQCDESRPEVSNNDQFKRLNDELNQLREHYRNMTPCIDLIIEIGIECLIRDCIQLIQKSDPSITEQEIEWFTTRSLPMQQVLARLSRLHKIAELAVISTQGHLPWDPTRILLRHAFGVYRYAKDDVDLDVHPLFIIGLSTQTTRPLLEYWCRKIPPTEFKLKLGDSIEAIFELNNGGHDLRELKDLHEIYPKNDINEPLTDGVVQYPIYIWESWFNPTHEKDHQSLNSHSTSPKRTNGSNQDTDDVPMTYTLTLRFDDPV